MNRRAFLALMPAVAVAPAVLMAMRQQDESDMGLPRRFHVSTGDRDAHAAIPMRVFVDGELVSYLGYDVDAGEWHREQRDANGEWVIDWENGCAVHETVRGRVAVKWDTQRLDTMSPSMRRYWQSRGAPV